MKITKAKRFVTAGAASALAAALIIGGSFAYLNQKTEDVINNFNPNKVMVELTETTGDTYDILPGVTNDKDPKVSVDATTPCYVYVTVVDSAPGLLTYEIADGWTEITVPGVTKSGSTSSTKVYYKEIDGYYDRTEGKWYTDDTKAEEINTKDMSVLKDDKVSYDASLENEDMLKTNGKLKTSQKLKFTAYAVQKAGFDTPEAGYTGANSKVATEFADLKGSTSVMTPIILKNDVTIDGESNQIGGKKDIDLNGHAIIFNNSNTRIPAALYLYGAISPSGEFKVSNGTLDGGNAGYGIALMRGDYLEIDNVVIKNAAVHGAYTAAGPITITGQDTYIESNYDTQNNKYMVLNVLDKDYNSGKTNIIVKGGTYKNFDPANNLAEGNGTNFVADGYHTEAFKIQNDGTDLGDASDYDFHTNYDAEDYAYYYVVVPDGQTATYTGTMNDGIPQFTIA